MSFSTLTSSRRSRRWDSKEDVNEEREIKFLGEGSFAKVYLMVDLEDERQNGDKAVQYACKQIDLSSSSMKKEDILQEVTILRALKHPHVIALFRSYIIDSTILHVHMEYAPHGDLGIYIKNQKKTGKRFALDDIMAWTTQIVYALDYIHAHGIIHRDIKPPNCFVCYSGIIKLGDFGMSKQTHWYKHSVHGFFGTPYYMSPEVLFHHDYSFKADMWSFGATVYELITLHKPFRANNIKELRAEVANLRYERLKASECNSVLAETVSALLVHDVEERPSSHDVAGKDEFQTLYHKMHPFDPPQDSSKGFLSKIADVFRGKSRPQSPVAARMRTIRRSTNRSTDSSPASGSVSSSWRDVQLSTVDDGRVIVNTPSNGSSSLSFPQQNDRVAAQASEDGQGAVRIVRDDTEYWLSLSRHSIIDSVLHKLVPKKQRRRPNGMYLQVFNNGKSRWELNYVVVFEHHLFLGDVELDLHHVEIVPLWQSEFHDWPPETLDSCRLLLAERGRRIAVVTPSPLDSRKFAAAILEAGCKNPWQIQIETERMSTKLLRHLSLSVSSTDPLSPSPLKSPTSATFGALRSPLYAQSIPENDKIDEPPASAGPIMTSENGGQAYNGIAHDLGFGRGMSNESDEDTRSVARSATSTGSAFVFDESVARSQDRSVAKMAEQLHRKAQKDLMGRDNKKREVYKIRILSPIYVSEVPHDDFRLQQDQFDAWLTGRQIKAFAQLCRKKIDDRLKLPRGANVTSTSPKVEAIEEYYAMVLSNPQARRLWLSQRSVDHTTTLHLFPDSPAAPSSPQRERSEPSIETIVGSSATSSSSGRPVSVSVV